MEKGTRIFPSKPSLEGKEDEEDVDAVVVSSL
jgi:hypothetical protein